MNRLRKKLLVNRIKKVIHVGHGTTREVKEVMKNSDPNNNLNRPIEVIISYKQRKPVQKSVLSK